MPAEPASLVRCHAEHLAARCRQRGYTLNEVAACIVRQEGEQLLVDTEHPAFPREPRPGFQPTAACGPGTELKRLLGRIGITASESCGCNAKARAMDAHGCDWCDENINIVVGWLREEAGRRRLPWLDAVGKVLVRRAISNARKEMARAKAAKEGEAQGPAVR